MGDYLEGWNVDGWNADYYDVVEHYFWAPGTLGRRPMEDVRPLEIFRRLRRNEEPLNHVLLFFFRLAPRDVTQRIFQTWFGEERSAEFEIQNSYQVNRTLSAGFTQPDLFFSHPDVSFMIEMKIQARSSADQVLKYVALSHLESKHANRVKPMRLAYLGLGGIESTFPSQPKDRAQVIDRVAKLDRSAYRHRWSFLDDEDWAAIDDRLHALELRFQTYGDLDGILAAYESSVDPLSPYSETVERLLRGVRAELSSRGLV
jgi:hypothetical protein